MFPIVLENRCTHVRIPATSGNVVPHFKRVP